MYYLEFGMHSPDAAILFLPERTIPDEFYTTFAKDADFEIEAFRPYRVEMDKDLGWVRKIGKIMADNPEPRCQHERPVRPLTAKLAVASAQAGEIDEVAKQVLPAQLRGARHAEAMMQGHRRFFYTTMDQCSRRYVLHPSDPWRTG
jgi:hypothetical protein